MYVAYTYLGSWHGVLFWNNVKLLSDQFTVSILYSKWLSMLMLSRSKLDDNVNSWNCAFIVQTYNKTESKPEFNSNNMLLCFEFSVCDGIIILTSVDCFKYLFVNVNRTNNMILIQICKVNLWKYLSSQSIMGWSGCSRGCPSTFGIAKYDPTKATSLWYLMHTIIDKNRARVPKIENKKVIAISVSLVNQFEIFYSNSILSSSVTYNWP